MQVIIMRGAVGSGKTTWAKQLPNATICSADDYHLIDGVYAYKPQNAPAAHAQCLEKFATMLHRRCSGKRLMADYLVVDNTSTTAWEIAPYYQLAVACKLPARIVRMYCTVEDSHRRNIHAVPLGTILQMHNALATEKLPPWWKEIVVMHPNEKRSRCDKCGREMSFINAGKSCRALIESGVYCDGKLVEIRAGL